MSDYGNEVETLNITSNLAWDAMGGTANLILGARSIEQDFLLNFPFQRSIFFPTFSSSIIRASTICSRQS